MPMTVEQLKTWLKDWIARTTNLPEEEIDEFQPMERLNLSSRDVVVLSGELERLLGVTLEPIVAYQYPTIDALAHYLANPAGGVGAGASTSPGADTVHAGAATAGAPGAAVSGGASVPTLGAHDIAIVGMAARFPGGENLDQMWDLLASGRSAVGDLPEGRWSEYSNDPVTMQKIKSINTIGGYLSDIETFDAEFFGLSPLEATNMDPQQRIVLEVAWHALENAGIPANTLRGTSTGVFIGSSNNDYGMLVTSDPEEAHPYALTGTASSIIPNRLSYALDLRGPSVSVDTACSSSLVAIHQAVRALRAGEADTALAGGVNILASPFVSTAFGELGVLSPSGAIHAFSADADGFIRGEGAGILVLKRVADALADGDTIHAVIKGSAVNSDGHSNGLTAPNPDAQVDVLQRAYRDAGVDPSTVDYVEAHGTGTILGDPIEAQALGQVLGAGRPAYDPLLVGSSKTNFGHTESAAGAAAIIKVVLSLQHDTLPPSLNYTEPNPYIDFEADRLEVVEDVREWPMYSGRRISGVSGFGFGGTNAHVVVSDFHPEDYRSHTASADQPGSADQPAAADHSAGATSARPPAFESDSVLLPVSGLLPSRRRSAAAHLADYLESSHLQNADLPALSRTLAGRNHARSRAVVTASTVEEAVTRLRKVAEGKKLAGVASADAPSSVGPVFVYSGFGSQHRKMVKDLVASAPTFTARLKELDELIVFESGWSLLEKIADDSQTYDTETGQASITAIQIALTDYVASLGVKPAAVMGMSMGEIAAAYACGGLPAEDAMRIACHRSRLMGEGEQLLPEDRLGAMAVAELSAEELEQFNQSEQFSQIEPAVYAGPGMLTVGGPEAQVQALVQKLEAEGKFVRLLKVKGAGHTSYVDPILGELEAEISDIQPQPIRIPLFSSVDQAVVYQPGQTVHDPDYWLRCTRQSVRFQDATEQALAAGHTMLVEISPHPVALMGMMSTALSLGKADAQLLFTLKRKIPADQSLLDLLAALYVSGQPVDIAALVGTGKRLPVPGTAFEKNRYWTDSRPSSGSSALPGTRVTLPTQVAYTINAASVPSLASLIDAAVPEGLTRVALEEYAMLPSSGELTTQVERNVAGAVIRVYSVAENITLLAEAFAGGAEGASRNAGASTLLAGASTLPAGATATGSTIPGGATATGSDSRWHADSGESVADHLRFIVSESMGYEVEDLPDELPLIDLGLDSLMGMRIKNRVENDFQIPPLDVQTLRDASVADVITLVEEAVRKRNDPEVIVAAQAQEAQEAEEAQAAQAAAAHAAHHQQNTAAPAESDSTADTPQGAGVAPRDASERLVFATWAGITGQAAAGVTSPLPAIDQPTAQKIADRLNKRANSTLTAADILAAGTLEPLADAVRDGLEVAVEGNIRILRERPEGSSAPSVFMFHPAGGSSVVYEPLTRCLNASIPVYGVERLEGSLEDRAQQYVEDILKLSTGHPLVLGGWSFGGALAMEVAKILKQRGQRVDLIALLDTVRPAEDVPDTMEETKARWDRYAAFANKTYNLDIKIPHELLETAGEDALIQMMAAYLSSPEAAAHGVAAGVLEHQRASFVDNQILGNLALERYADLDIPVLLFRAERMHDGAIELEPRYAKVKPDGGWGDVVKDLEIVQLHGDHLAVVDEPEIATVAVNLERRLLLLESDNR